MARNFYQVTLNGKDMPGIRWATKDTAQFSIKVEWDPCRGSRRGA